MTESELYKNLGELTRDKERWEDSIPYVSSLLPCESVKIQAKAIWLLGEMGLAFPSAIEEHIRAIVSFLDSEEAILRERAVNAMGRIGRRSFQSIEPYWSDLFRFVYDRTPGVRLAFIWASENIATNTPDPYRDHMPVFGRLLYDEDDKVRMEAPEIFRVLGKRRPDFAEPYLDELQHLTETDPNCVVRIHCQGAIKAATGIKMQQYVS